MRQQIYNPTVLLTTGGSEPLADILPHGAGIDAKWTFYENGNNLYCCNSYHCMNEVGYYDGWADFYITIPLESTDWRSDFKLHFNGQFAQHKNYKYMMREYLEDAIQWSLEQVAQLAAWEE